MTYPLQENSLSNLYCLIYRVWIEAEGHRMTEGAERGQNAINPEFYAILNCNLEVNIKYKHIS